ISFPQGDEEAYVGNCVTAPQYRGTGIYPAGLLALARALSAEGRRWLYLFVEDENLASIRGVEKAGMKPVARCSVYGVRGSARRRFRLLPGIPDADAIGRWEVVEGSKP